MSLAIWDLDRGARWPRGHSARRAIAEATFTQASIFIGWVTKIYNLERLRALKGTLSRWSRLHLQSFVPTSVSRRVDVRQAAGHKNNCRILITTWWKHVVPTSLSGIRVGKRKNKLRSLCYPFGGKAWVICLYVCHNEIIWKATFVNFHNFMQC
jgi:hypothetical protein